MNIELIESQVCKVYIKLLTEEAFEVYGGTTKQQFSVSNTENGEHLVLIKAPDSCSCDGSRYDIFARRKSSNQEWLILSGRITTNSRKSSVGSTAVSPLEYHLDIPVTENIEDLEIPPVYVGIKGDTGYSTYDIACQQGFEGTEEEWLASLKAEYASEAVKAVEPYKTEAEQAAINADISATDAAQSARDAAQSASRAEEHMTASAAHKDTACEHMNAAAKSAAEAEQSAGAAAGSAAHAAACEAEALGHAGKAEGSAEQAQRSADDASASEMTASEHMADAEEAATKAEASAAAAAGSETAAEQAKAGAQEAQAAAEAARAEAEAQALAAATSASEAQSPASIAAQSARVYTMLLLKDELLEMLGAGAYDVDTDGAKIIVHTDRLDDTQIASVDDMLARFVPGFIDVERYNHNIEIKWNGINKYAQCVTRADMLAVNANYKDDFTSDGEWIYPLSRMTVCSDRYASPAWYLFEGVKQRIFITEMPDATNVYRMFRSCEFDEVRLTLPNFRSQTQGVVFGDSKIRKAVLVAPKWEDMGWLCHGAQIETLEIDAPVTRLDYLGMYGNGKYVLKNVKLTTQQLTTADSAFANAQLTRESALHILSILPHHTSGSHPLTIGIHVDNQTDEEVVEAIAEAEGKGWTIKVQWNGTATSGVSALDLDEIYAKKEQNPDGMYVDSNGVRYMVDWGHIVTSPDATPAELGYNLYYSLDEALTEWGLTEYEDNTISNQ